MKHWSNGKILNGDTKISSFNFALHYANPVVWEGIRAYKCKDGKMRVYKNLEHAQRLIDSATIMGFIVPYEAISIAAACDALIKHFPKEDLYIRPIAYIDASCEGVDYENGTINLDIYAIPFGAGYSSDGIKVITSSYFRGHPCDIMQAKTSANYSKLGLFKNEAIRAGVDDVLVRNPRGYYTEASVANLFLVKGNQIITPPNDGDILPGITRQTLVTDILTRPEIIFKKHRMGLFEVKEKNITKADLLTADEVFICGTYAEVTPVVEIDGQKIGNGSVGSVTSMLQLEYSILTRG